MRLLGYVATTYAKRNISLVRKDIETYAAWPTKSSNPALAVRGIFFDETPQQYDADALAYLEDLTEVVKNTEGFGPDPLVSPCLFAYDCYRLYRCILRFTVTSLFFRHGRFPLSHCTRSILFLSGFS